MNRMDDFTSFGSRDTVQKAMANCYLWMALGLVITGATSFLLYSSGLFISMLMAMPFLPLALGVFQIVLTFMFSSAMSSANANKLKVLFITYAVTFGITMTSLAYAFGLGTIALAFGVSAVYFLCLAFIGTTTNKDLTKLGTICIVALLTMVVTQLFMMIFRVNMDVRLYSFIGLLIFTGMTAFDIQQMKRILIASDGCPIEQEKMSIYFALDLYLDFINIFIYILQILGSNSDD